MEQFSLFDREGNRKYLTPEERVIFTTAAGEVGKERRAFGLMLYYTGCRISEALNLEVRHIVENMYYFNHPLFISFSFQIFFQKKNYLPLLFMLLSYAGFSQTLSPQEIAYKDQFDEVLESNMSDSAKLQYIVQNGYKAGLVYTDTPVPYLKKGVALATQLNDIYQRAHLYLHLGEFYRVGGQRDKAASFYELGIKDYLEFPKGKKLAEAYVYYALFSMNDNDAEKTFEYVHEAIKIYELFDGQREIGTTYIAFSFMMLGFNRLEEGLAYAEKAWGILEIEGTAHDKAAALDQLAMCHRKLENYPQAVKYINTCIEMVRQNKPVSANDLIIFLDTRAKTYIVTEEYKMALQDLSEMEYLINDNTHYDYEHTTLIYDRGRILSKQKKQEASNQVYFSLLKFPTLQANGLESSVLSALSLNYVALNQYDSAYYYHLAAEESEMEAKEHETLLKMDELNTQYQTKEKEERILTQESELSQQRVIQWLAIGFAGVLGLLFLQSYRNAQARKRSNEALEKTNSLLEIKNKENEILLKEIHHRVKNNLQTISSLLNLQSNSITDPTALDAVQESRNRVASMAMIHQKLYQGENLAAIEMRDYFETIGKAIIDSFGEKAENISLKVEMKDIELDVDTAVPVGLITNELITNSLKYAFPNNQKGQILITLAQEKNGLLKLHIADDGQGITNESVVKKEKGFGTLLVQLLTTQLRGKLDKSTEKGTSTIIQFPLQKKSVA